MFYVPPWIFAVVGLMVIAFGAFRIKLSFRSQEEDEKAKQRGGLYGINKRTHLIIGVLYILLGIYLELGAFGIRIVP